MENPNYQNSKLPEEPSIREYDEFRDRHKTWEQIRTERYNSC
nr:hypothetical protein [uncultured archaeon]